MVMGSSSRRVFNCLDTSSDNVHASSMLRTNRCVRAFSQAWRRVNSRCGTIRQYALTDAGLSLDGPPSQALGQKGGPEWNDDHIRLFLRYEPGTAVPRHGVDGINGLGAHELGLEAVLVLIGSREKHAGVLPAKIEANAFVPCCSEGLGHRFVELRNSSAVRGNTETMAIFIRQNTIVLQRALSADGYL